MLGDYMAYWHEVYTLSRERQNRASKRKALLAGCQPRALCREPPIQKTTQDILQTMPFAYKTLIHHLRSLSLPTTSDEEIFRQWRQYDVDTGHTNCNCGHEDIFYQFRIENIYTGQRTYVGSVCIHRFPPNTYVSEQFYFIFQAYTQGVLATFIGKESGRDTYRFRIRANTNLVRGARRLRRRQIRIPSLLSQPWGRNRHRYMIRIQVPAPFRSHLHPTHRIRLFLKFQWTPPNIMTLELISLGST